ncbi:MAG: phosphoenolpyruvate synthase [Candidatus Undinarchaeales archaeon]
MKVTAWFDELRKDDIALAGGKGANLGELLAAGLPVPNGFVVTAETYKDFIEETDIKTDIDELLKEIDVNNNDQLNSAAKAIKGMIKAAKMPDSVKEDIVEAYNEFDSEEILIAGSDVEPGEFVAVRSSATAEDLPGASFAGQQRTFLNVKGKTELIDAVKGCWASLFEPRAIYYRQKKGFDHEKVFISVIIQKMVDSDKAGVMFTVNPAESDESKISIDAAWGLGEAIVGGEVTPDNYVVDKKSMQIVSKNVSEKPFMYTRDLETGKTKKVNLSEETAKKQVLTEDEIQQLAEYGKQIEKHYGYPQDIEWALEDSKIYIVQSRPVTTLAGKDEKESEKMPDNVEQIIEAEPEEKPEKSEPKKAEKESMETEVPFKSGETGKEKKTIQMPAAQGLVKKPEEGGKSEPETKETEPKEVKPKEMKSTTAERKSIVKGFDASPGIGAGKVKIIHSASELSKIQKGDILVTEMTTPDMVPAMERASAIVTDSGGTTCHAAIVSRELGIPCIVGTGNATSVLKDHHKVTVDARKGVVYDGIVKDLVERKEEEKKTKEVSVENAPVVTATKMYVNLGIPDKAEEVSKLPVDGVGLMREEFIFASLIGEHPLALIEKGEQEKFINTLAGGIQKVAKAFNPRPVVLRLSDFKTNEYHDLKGGEKFEQKEDNPMLGWRGCSRYTSKKYEPAFRLELKAVKKARDNGYKNIIIMLPFVRTLDDVKSVSRMMQEEGLERGPDLKLWMMAEVPSNVLLADEFAKLVDGFSIGSNDLTQLIMGADRDSRILEELGYFNENDPAVKKAISHLIETAHENNCTISICGQKPSTDTDFARFLVEKGIDSISVNADVAVKTKNIIASEERKILLGKVRKGEELSELEKKEISAEPQNQ